MDLKLLYICDSSAQPDFLKKINYKLKKLIIKIQVTPQQSPVQPSPMISLLKTPAVQPGMNNVASTSSHKNLCLSPLSA